MSLYVQTDYVSDLYTQDRISIDWPRGVIFIPKDELTLVQTTPTEIRNMDLNWFRLQLKDLEDSPEGMTWLKTHNHNTEVSLGGLTYARVIELLEPYTVTFEDGQYAVNLIGANSNVGDRVNVNNVSVRSANSAGLISSPAIEFASFNGGVIIDVVNGTTGTAFPRGTEQMPVNNIYDALLICEYRGFKTLYLHSDILLDGGSLLSGFELIGKSHISTQVTIEPSAIVDEVTISDCEINGTMDGYTTITDCVVSDILYMNGHIHNSSLVGKISLDGGLDGYINNCGQLSIGGTPIIDMGGSGQNLVLSNYTGILKFINLSGSTNTIGIGLTAGYIILDSTTFTAGHLIISGIGELIDENGNRILSGVWNGGVVIENNLLNRYTISEATQLSEYVYIDSINGVTGTTFPIGTKRTPVNNIPDAVIIANDLGIKDLFFLNDHTIGSDIYITDFGLVGAGVNSVNLTFVAGCLVPKCHTHEVSLTGNLSGISGIYDSRVNGLGSIGIIPSSQEIIVSRTLIDGTITLPSNYSGKLTVLDCYSNVPGPSTPTLNFGSSTAQLQIRNYSGGIQLVNVTQGNLISIDLNSGNVKLANSVTNATIVARGVGKMVESSTGNYIPSGIWNGGVNVSNDIISKGTIAEAVGIEIGTEIQYSVYNNMVLIDPLYGTTGTTYPIGTQMMPAKNIDDAIVIANERGFNTLKFLNNYTFLSGTTLNNYKVYGTGMQQMEITIQSGSDFTGTEFHDATYHGNITDPTGFINCRLQSITLDTIVTGLTEVLCEFCILQTEIKIATDNNVIVEFLNCWSFPDVVTRQPPRLDMNYSTANVNLRNHSGGLKILHNDKPNDIRIYLNSGRIQLDSTITAGNFLLIGVGTLANNTTSVTSLEYSGLLSKDLVSLAVWDESLTLHTNSGSTGRALSLLQFDGKVWLDPSSGFSGTTFPNGTQGSPVNNGPDALQIAIRENITEFRIQGNFTTTTNLSEFTIAGDTFLDDGLTFNNNVYSGITFKNLHLDGVATFTDCEFVDCYIENIEGLSGELINCRLSNNILIPDGGRLSGVEIVVEGDNTIIDCMNTPGTVSLDINSGYILFTNFVDNCLIELNMKGGEVELDSTCVGGEYYFEGIGTLFNNSTMTEKDNHLLALETIPVYVWDEQLSGHTTTGSAGKALSTASSGGVDYGLLAQAVWDEYLSGHTTNDTAAFIMKQIATLADELHKIQGLDPTNPMNVTPTKRTSGSILLDITGDGKTTTTVTRQ